ncbi:alpha/beta hydrolase [Streptomyces sp. NPDC005438]|uniref:alpha/beta fold hydrolase n=1 Tax=Streptomyces sp. NPDC005438 TaxID=3156880 RepID=UPI00339FB631
MSSRPETLTLRVRGLEFDALVAGPETGPLVLLLHGWPEFADSWAPALEELATAGYRALAVNQRGYSPGARPEDPEAYALAETTADALAFADSQGADTFHLVGHDWGGIIGWYLAGEYPERLRSLSVLSTAHPLAVSQAMAEDPEQRRRFAYIRFFREPEQAAEKALLAEEGKALSEVYEGRVPPELAERYVRRLSEPGALTASLNWYRAMEGGPNLQARRTTVPTLYVWGSEDVAFSREMAEATGDHVDAPYRFHPLEGASHWLPEEVPERINLLLLEQLAAYRG